MLKKLLILFLSLFTLFIFSCTETKTDSTNLYIEDTAEEREKETEAEIVTEPEVQPLPAVVLRDDASIWENEEGSLSAKPIVQLDMGTEVQYLGVDEDLKSGSNVYSYSKIQLADGIEGWISTVRLAKNAAVGVVAVESGLYKRPSITSPINRTVPAGQIVAVSLEVGNVEGYAKISFSYYFNDKISTPEHRYIVYKNISSDTKDIETAKLVLKAFRNVDQRNDFLNLAFTLDSVFKTTGRIKGDQFGYKFPEMTDDPMALPDNVDVLAVNPQNEGEALPWFLVQLEDQQLLWMRSDGVALDNDIRESVLHRTLLTDKSTYTGQGVPSVILYQNLSFRVTATDKEGKETLQNKGSLELGQVVYYMNEDKLFNDIEYSKIEITNGQSGWCSKAYLAIDTVPAVITKSDVSQFSDARLTSLSPIKIQRFQIVAQSLKEESGFFKISYSPIDKDLGLQREVYIQKMSAPSSYMKNDIDATKLFHLCLNEEDPDLADLYLRKASEIPSFFQDEISDLFYEAKEDLTESSASDS